MAEKKTKTTAAKPVAEKKEAVKKTTAKKTTKTTKEAQTKISINAENVGFRAGDVYQTLFAAEKSMTVEEIAKVSGKSREEVLLGIGWLFKEGKIKDDQEKITLA